MLSIALISLAPGYTVRTRKGGKRPMNAHVRPDTGRYALHYSCFRRAAGRAGALALWISIYSSRRCL